MKKLLSIILIIFVHQLIVGQPINQKAIQAISINDEVVSYAIPGSQHPMLIAKEKKMQEFLEMNPDARKTSLGKTMSWGFNVGDTHTWWADYFEESDSGEEQYQVPSTCRGVGLKCYVFVEDAVWGTSQVNQTAVDAIVSEFDSNIYPTDVATFGTPPDFDNDERIIILILDIQDGWSSGTGGGYVAGYFYSLNQVADSPGVDGSRSNEAEIFYMDCNPADLITDQTDVLSTTAHEFQHMIHYAYGNEMTFINEGLSEIASYICGYDFRNDGLYAQNTNRNLLSWDGDDSLPDYTRAALWTLYLYEQFGVNILKDFVENSHGDWVAIDNTVRPYFAAGFITLMTDWWIANYVNGSSAESKYTYQFTPLTTPTPAASHIGNSGTGSGKLQPFSVEYITFTNGNDLTITFTGDNVVKVKALKIGSLEVEDVPKNTPYSPSGYGTTYPEVTFMVYNESAGATQDYAYTATGADVNVTMELAYEDGISDGTFALSTGDSLAVIFFGVAGAKLDSVKTFHSGTGKIYMDISEFDGNNFLRGQQLFSANRTILNSGVWNKIDLTSQNLDASNDFVVSYLLGSDPANPTIGVRDMDPTGFYHSRTFTGGSWAQYYSDRNNDNSYDAAVDGNWNYLIRAYVSIGNATVAIDPSGVVTIPKDFSLGTNYPNPFNPITTFNFATPNDGVINFTVYDLLGQVIYSENRNLLAGNYQFTWDGQNQLDQQVVSGVYFLQMEADGFTQTRKMLMMK